MIYYNYQAKQRTRNIREIFEKIDSQRARLGNKHVSVVSEVPTRPGQIPSQEKRRREKKSVGYRERFVNLAEGSPDTCRARVEISNFLYSMALCSLSLSLSLSLCPCCSHDETSEEHICTHTHTHIHTEKRVAVRLLIHDIRSGLQVPAGREDRARLPVIDQDRSVPTVK